MTKVKIVSADGTKSVDGYIDHGKTETEKQNQVTKDRLHTIYLVLAITFFSLTIFTFVTKPKH